MYLQFHASRLKFYDMFIGYSHDFMDWIIQALVLLNHYKLMLCNSIHQCLLFLALVLEESLESFLDPCLELGCK